ncbi:arylsulfatase [Anseongella ginsenosidimutans]|nr:arylsulfatase [Anseongella ginsenosidimutans]
MKPAIFLFLAFSLFQPSLTAQEKVNIIYIYADDLGYGELGCYGQEKIRTPHLDRMAREGMRFTQHYTSIPVCAPARGMLLTGMHAGHAYIRGNYELGGFADSLEGGQMPLHEGAFTLPRMLKQVGYATAAIGKWGLGMHNTTGAPLKQGFDYFYGYLDQKQAHNYYPTHLWANGRWDTLNNPRINVHRALDPAAAGADDFAYFKGNEYSGEKMTEKALDFITAHKAGPFFLYLPYTIPHASLQVPEKYTNAYLGEFEEQPYYGQNGYAAAEHPYATYAGMITFLDAQVGMILDRLRELGLDENTLVMFSSDNGTTFNGGVNAEFFNSTGGLRGLKQDLFEGGIRMPFIARWPGKIPAGTVSDHISAQYDIMATLAELTGQELRHTDGISLLPTLLGKNAAQEKHEYLYFEYHARGGQLAVRMGDWKGVKVKQQQHAAENPWMIFNLRTDPGETTNLAARHPELARKFDAIVKDEHRPAHIREWEFLNPKFALTN